MSKLLPRNVKKIAVNVADRYDVVYDLSNGTIFSDCVQPRTEIWRSRHYVTLNISEMVQDNRCSCDEILLILLVCVS